MIFLVVYDRGHSKTVTLQRFEDSQRVQALIQREALELQPENRVGNREVVLLEANTEDELRQTHARYFLTLEQLAKSAMNTVAES